MKLKVEVDYNNKLYTNLVNYNDFCISILYNQLMKIPNFKPNLIDFQEEDKGNKTFSIMRFNFQNTSKKDSAIVRVIPMFEIMEEVLSR